MSVVYRRNVKVLHMEQVYFIGIPIYFIVYSILAAFFIRHESITKPNEHIDKLYIAYIITVGVFSAFVWPIAIISAAIFFAIIGSSAFLSKFI